MIIYNNGTDELFAWRKKLRKNKNNIIFSWSIQDHVLVLFPDRNDTKWKLYFLDFPFMHLQFSWQNSLLDSCLGSILNWCPRNKLCALYKKKMCAKNYFILYRHENLSLLKSHLALLLTCIWWCGFICVEGFVCPFCSMFVFALLGV